ncbi:MAG: molybdopterin-synthase adenylyltransferase MoeB [Thiotrichaceae bacterium]|nr:molybdopterin-synthase adenylyltransferase MoeB [Thiotrichaceae bacterium]
MDDSQLLRYSRQILLPQIGIEGQERLRAARVLMMGLGGLGSPAALYLAAAGVGHLVLCDIDTVELSNLQRQIIHSTATIGHSKVESARERLHALNPLIKISQLPSPWSLESLRQSLASIDVVLDCTDNLHTRLIINQACLNAKVPLISGAAIRFEGQISVFRNDLAHSPCYCCLYPQTESTVETCSQNGVLAPIVGIIGSLQAVEALKLIMQIGENLVGRLLLLDTFTMESQIMTFPKNPHCPVCAP